MILPDNFTPKTFFGSFILPMFCENAFTKYKSQDLQ